MTDVRLVGACAATNHPAFIEGLRPTAGGGEPGLLVSFFYLKQFQRSRSSYGFRDWVMDSGAFSAHASGGTIDLVEYIETAKELITSDTKLTEVFSLDVIGDWRASMKNTEAMWKAGIPAIPCYHVGEPEDVLISIAKEFDKIALGGAVGFRGKGKWAAQCFARVWPAKIHGFGFGAETDIMSLPWHSVDATNWEIGPCAFGTWQAFGGANLGIKGSQQPLRVEVERYLSIERRAKERWKKEMRLLDTMKPKRTV